MHKIRLSMVVSLCLIVALLGGFLPYKAAQAQESVTLQLAVPDVFRDTFSGRLISDFEAANPNVKVQLVNAPLGIPDPVTGGLDQHFEEVGKYAQSADVLFVFNSMISVEATLAGYFLDLAPLIQVDSAINIDDFYPAIWRSFQWNRGIWALPTAADVLLLTYDPVAFDNAGLAYPNEHWTMDDLAAAARKLVQKDAAGKVTLPPINLPQATYDVLVMRALVSEGLYDETTVPNTPRIAREDVEALLAQYFELDKEGLIGRGVQGAPMSVGQVLSLLVQADPEQKRVGVLLPGNKAGITPQGFALSGGTQYPQQAYELAKFLTTRSEVANTFSTTPARKSLLGAESGQGFTLNVPQELRALVELGVANGITLSDLRFGNYLVVALQQMRTAGLDAHGALQQVETQALDNQNAAIAKKDGNTFTVAPPAPVTQLQSGKISLKFGYGTFISPLPNQEKWDRAIADFVASDPQVGRIEFEASIRALQSLEQAAQTYDCFYMPYNAVPGAQLNVLLNLDPLMASDTSFDKNDVVGNVLAQLQRDNKTWGYPLTIEPSILKYDSDRFNAAGVPAPPGEWTINAFNDALKTLKVDPADPPPFIPSNTGGVHLLILIAAYGGLPLDYRTNPPTIQYTDPKVVEAIRQALDLARDGYIKYSALGTLNFGFGGQQERGIIINVALNLFTLGSPAAPTGEDAYKPTTYPRGSEFSAISYAIGTAYISATSQNPEACYRWISKIASTPELFQSMPARRAQINDPMLSSIQGPEVTALYNTVDRLLQDPNTISLPSLFDASSSPTSFLLQYWLFQAFDAYVLRDADLEPALSEAEGYAKGFQECAATLPPLDNSSQQAALEYARAFGACATKVDARLKPLFDLIR